MPTMNENTTKPETIATSVKRCRVTEERPSSVDCEEHIQKPGTARANIAASVVVPQGSNNYREKYKDYTVLQQHVLFWDRDGDGMITPLDTYRGFRDLGFNIIFSFLAMLIININFSLPTRLAHSWIPDPFFNVYVDGIHKAKHGSDSGVFDPEGRFVPQAFENIFSKYDKTESGSLSLGELFDMVHGHRCAVDPFGWGAAFFEWGSTWLLIQKNGRVYKEDVRQIYDGSLFWKVKAEREKTQG